jgi:hypothetical protein
MAAAMAVIKGAMLVAAGRVGTLVMEVLALLITPPYHLWAAQVMAALAVLGLRVHFLRTAKLTTKLIPPVLEVVLVC